MQGVYDTYAIIQFRSHRDAAQALTVMNKRQLLARVSCFGGIMNSLRFPTWGATVRRKKMLEICLNDCIFASYIHESIDEFITVS